MSILPFNSDLLIIVRQPKGSLFWNMYTWETVQNIVCLDLFSSLSIYKNAIYKYSKQRPFGSVERIKAYDSLVCFSCLCFKTDKTIFFNSYSSKIQSNYVQFIRLFEASFLCVLKNAILGSHSKSFHLLSLNHIVHSDEPNNNSDTTILLFLY